MVIGHCLAHRLATRFPLSIQETLTGTWKTVLGSSCGNCVCFHPEFSPLPEIMEETVAESELAAFDEAWFAIQQALTEEEARLWRQASLTRVDFSRALLKCKYSLWLQFWTPRLKKTCKNKRGRELERRRKAVEAAAEAAGGSVPSPGPKLLKRLFENEAASTAATGPGRSGSSDLQRELDGVRGRSMVRRSDRASHSKSANRLMAADGAAAAVPELEGKSVRKALFPDEAEVSRRREQRRRELIHQHEHPRKPTPLMDLNVKVQLDLNVKVHQEKRSKSLHRLMGQSETAESSRTVHFVPAGAESPIVSSRESGPSRLQFPSSRIISNRASPPVMPPTPLGLQTMPPMPPERPTPPPSCAVSDEDWGTAFSDLKGTRPWPGRKSRSGMTGPTF